MDELIDIEGDITRLDSGIAIVHQCACINPGGGINSHIFERYPYADLAREYHERWQQYQQQPLQAPVSSSSTVTEDESSGVRQTEQVYERMEQYSRNMFGSICVRSPDDASGPHVVAIMGKYTPGNVTPDGIDSAQSRMDAFRGALSDLSQWVAQNQVNMIAFPYMIGCGMSGGRWPSYRREIENFRSGLENCEVLIVQLPGTWQGYDAADFEAQHSQAEMLAKQTAMTVLEDTPDAPVDTVDESLSPASSETPVSGSNIPVSGSNIPGGISTTGDPTSDAQESREELPQVPRGVRGLFRRAATWAIGGNNDNDLDIAKCNIM